MEHSLYKIDEPRDQTHRTEEKGHNRNNRYVYFLAVASESETVNEYAPRSKEIVRKMRDHAYDDIFRFHDQRADYEPYEKLIDKLLITPVREREQQRRKNHGGHFPNCIKPFRITPRNKSSSKIAGKTGTRIK